MQDLELVFQKLDSRHKAESRSDVPKTSYEDPYSNRRARTGAIVAIVIALLTYAAIGWLAGWLS